MIASRQTLICTVLQNFLIKDDHMKTTVSCFSVWKVLKVGDIVRLSGIPSSNFSRLERTAIAATVFNTKYCLKGVLPRKTGNYNELAFVPNWNFQS